MKRLLLILLVISAGSIPYATACYFMSNRSSTEHTLIAGRFNNVQEGSPLVPPVEKPADKPAQEEPTPSVPDETVPVEPEKPVEQPIQPEQPVEEVVKDEVLVEENISNLESNNSIINGTE